MNPNLIVAAALLIGGLSPLAWQIRRARRATRRATRHIPAAPDNQPGTNSADLWTCRRINAATKHRKENQQP